MGGEPLAHGAERQVDATTGIAHARAIRWPTSGSRRRSSSCAASTSAAATNFPQYIGQDVYTCATISPSPATSAGRHDLRLGGEYLNYLTWHDWCNFLRGNLIADNGPVPANIEQLFPVWDDPNTWNIAALSPISREFRTAFGDCNIHSPRNIFGGWFQDDWQVDVAPDGEPRRAVRRGNRHLRQRARRSSRSCPATVRSTPTTSFRASASRTA